MKTNTSIKKMTFKLLITLVGIGICGQQLLLIKPDRQYDQKGYLTGGARASAQTDYLETGA